MTLQYIASGLWKAPPLRKSDPTHDNICPHCEMSSGQAILAETMLVVGFCLSILYLVIIGHHRSWLNMMKTSRWSSILMHSHLPQRFQLRFPRSQRIRCASWCSSTSRPPGLIRRSDQYRATLRRQLAAHFSHTVVKSTLNQPSISSRLAFNYSILLKCTIITIIIIFCCHSRYNYTSSTAQGGGGSFRMGNL